MKKARYSIGLMLVCAALVWGYYGSYRLLENRHQRELLEQQLGMPGEEILSADSAIQVVYVLRDRDGYVNVYLEDGTLYEVTGIRTAELPQKLQQEIGEGKVIEGSRNLYSFLENYSS